MELDAGQQRVLELDSGRHRVLAPPGSGKTELLSLRVQRAVENGVKPWRMGCLTFTNRAARSMSERVPRSCRKVFVGNFHAFGISFLRQNDLFPIGQSVLDEEDSRAFREAAVGSALRDRDKGGVAAEEVSPWQDAAPGLDIGIPYNSKRSPLAGLLSLYANWRRQVDADFPAWVVAESERLLQDGLKGGGNTLGELGELLDMAMDHYQRLKQESFAIDFDDILNLTFFHLVAREHRRPPFDWVQVDEAQDLDALQWAILEALSVPAGHLVVLGDIQQSIFSFRGGAYRLLVERTEGFTEHHLGRNYRSPGYLLDFFRDYAKQNLAHSEVMETDDQRARGKRDMLTLGCLDQDHEAGYVCERVVPGLLAQEDGRNVALLVRTNKDAKRLSADLYHQGIDHFTVSRYDIFQTRNGKDFMSLLTALLNPHSRFSWLRLLHLFGRTNTLQQAREVLNELFAASLSPLVFLGGVGLGGSGTVPDLAERVRQGRVVIFDTETTGLDTENDEIIQIAALELIKGEPGREFDLYLTTERDLGESEKIHHISQADLQEKGRPRREVLQAFLDFLAGDPLVAHNLEYDWNILQANLQREGMAEIAGDQPRFCSLFAARSLYPEAPRHKLAAMLEYLSLPGVNSHNALDDVRATTGLVRRMKDDFALKGAAAERVLGKHDALFMRFTENFKPLWDTFQKKRGEQWTFRKIYRCWCDRLGDKFPAYPRRHLAEVRDKIVRHMEHETRPASLIGLLRWNLPKYSLYREPDLILEEDRLVVSTIYRAKGLEFDTVLVPFCVKGTYPHFKAGRKPEGHREEARLLYVACTRAKSSLIISWHKLFKGHRKQLTPFLAKLQKAHFDTYEITRKNYRQKTLDMACPECGNNFKFDGSREKRRRCFECGHTPGDA